MPLTERSPPFDYATRATAPYRSARSVGVGLWPEAERQFRRIIGYHDLATLAIAIEHDLARTTIPSPTKEAATLITA